jgi:hypothetical protein
VSRLDTLVVNVTDRRKSNCKFNRHSRSMHPVTFLLTSLPFPFFSTYFISLPISNESLHSILYTSDPSYNHYQSYNNGFVWYVFMLFLLQIYEDRISFDIEFDKKRICLILFNRLLLIYNRVDYRLLDVIYTLIYSDRKGDITTFCFLK